MHFSLAKLSPLYIIFGILKKDKYTNVLNRVTLITKRYIFVCKCKEQKPCFQHLKLIIKENYHIEKIIYEQNDKAPVKFEDKWHSVKDSLLSL